MRISDASLRHTALRDLRSRLASLATAQLQSATGRRINTVSDAPADAAHVMRLESQIGDLTQYRRTAGIATTRLAAEENVVRSARDLIQQAKELARSVVNTDPGDPMRIAVDAQLGIIHDQLVALGNTQLGGEYLFGGALSTTPPFRADGTYVGDQTVRRAAVDQNLVVDTNHTGDDLLGNSLTAIAALRTNVATGTSYQVQSSMAGLDAAARELLTSEAEVGTRLSAVTGASRSLAARSAQIMDVRDGITNVDASEIALMAVTAQSALERAYAVTGRVLGQSLIDFLP